MSTLITEKALVNGTAGNDDLRADYQDNDGSYLRAGAGDDILRGGSSNDVLVGGTGSDRFFGGLGADQFRFFGYDVANGDVDKIYDLNFSGQGDLLVFSDFAAGTFTDAAGVNAVHDGSGVIVSSYEGLFNLVADSDAISASQRGATNTLILTVTYGEVTQTIELSNAYAAYAAFLSTGD